MRAGVHKHSDNATTSVACLAAIDVWRTKSYLSRARFITPSERHRYSALPSATGRSLSGSSAFPFLSRHAWSSWVSELAPPDQNWSGQQYPKEQGDQD